MKKTTIAGVLSSVGLATALLGAGAASATTVTPPEGGTWSYGVNFPSSVYSNYKYSGTHGSTACNGNGHCVYSPETGGGKYSYASDVPTWWGNTAYYHVG